MGQENENEELLDLGDPVDLFQWSSGDKILTEVGLREYTEPR
jgi:hypothetical protein